MTREEALKVLKKELQIIDDPNVTMTAREWEEHDDHMRDALEMAIAALKQLSLPKIIIRQGEQEPCDKRTETHACDCISRQDAIDAWWYDEVFFGNQRDDMTKEQWLDYIADVIGSIPSAQPERKTDGDTISRQDAIEAVHGSYDEILDFKSTGRTIADSVEDIISNLPSAQVEKSRGR